LGGGGGPRLLSLIIIIALKLVYNKAACKIYPPRIKTMELSGFAKVIISSTCRGAKLLPIIIATASAIQT